jgi:cellulose synthase/poly-beta-1,6-N-acetylglucosamine synthase-like glycosyltransferase
MMVEILFWSCLMGIIYVFVGYPLALWFISRVIRPHPPQDPSIWPTVSLVISAYNEEQVLAAKLENSLRVKYPGPPVDVLVVSDASTDETDAIAASYSHQGVRLLRVEGRLGKTNAQNEAIKHCSSEIVVFSDANAMYDPDALIHLVRHFTDPTVGVVEGRRLDHNPSADGVANLELTYRDYESWIKVLESRVATCTGATGPIYAVRRDYYVPLDPDTISDLMEPIRIRLEHKLRQMFEPQAISREEVLTRMANETARKVRIMTRCLTSITRVPGLLNPLHSGWFAIQVWSHRLLRWLLPILWIPHIASGLFLLHSPIPRLIMIMWMLFLIIAALGALLDHWNLGPSILRMPYYLFNANRAAWLAFVNWIRGRTVVTWNPDRS